MEHTYLVSIQDETGHIEQIKTKNLILLAQNEKDQTVQVLQATLPYLSHFNNILKCRTRDHFFNAL